MAKSLSNPIDSEDLLCAFAEFLRFALSDPEFSAVEFVQKYDLIPKLNALLDVPSHPIQLQIAWAMVELSYSFPEHCNQIIAIGCYKKLITLVTKEDLELAEPVLRRV